MRKERRFIYRFYLLDGNRVYTYCLRAKNAKCADNDMQKVIDRDFPECDILSKSRVCSESRFAGTLGFPVYVDDYIDPEKYYDELDKERYFEED